MELRTISDTNIKVTPIGVGTWVTGGWMWGGSEENESIEAIKTALENGVNLIDTAPVYGFGKSESIVGRTTVAIVKSSAQKTPLIYNIRYSKITVPYWS